VLVAVARVSCWESAGDAQLTVESDFLSFGSDESENYFYSWTRRGDRGGECLSLWINGGMGTSSYMGYFLGVGPYR